MACNNAPSGYYFPSLKYIEFEFGITELIFFSAERLKKT